MDNIKEAWGKVKGGWGAMDKRKRTKLIMILMAIILVIGSLTYFTNKVNYSVLFSDMNAADAGVIAEDLEAQGVKYKLEDGGSTILIDSSLVDKYRIELAMNDMVPENSVGFEIFDSASMMATDDDRSIMYQRAVAGELERAITALDSVDSAKVILSMPEDSVFVDQENRAEASASVVVTPRTSNIDASEVQGIASLIAGAVDNLPQENIKIVDTNGNLLSSVLGAEGLNSVDITSQYRQIEATYEEELVAKIKQTLIPIYGAENLTISVNASLNFDAVEEEKVDYDPNYTEGFETEGPTVRSESVQTGGSNMTIDETAGNDNTSNVIVEGEAEDGSTYNRTVNNEIDTTTTHTVKAPGAVEALTSSIVYNGNLNFEQTEQMQQIVASAIGATPEDIVVQGIPFATNEEPEPTPIIGEDLPEQFMEFLKQNWPYAVGGIVLIVLLILLMKWFKRRRDDDDEFDDLYDEIEEVEIKPPTATEAEKMKKAAEKEEADLRMQLTKTMTEKENKVKTLAKDNPDMAADLIKIWMKEE